jgi:SpoVK/Ycf46/Vps4 family AAA+-type ATPase
MTNKSEPLKKFKLKHIKTFQDNKWAVNERIYQKTFEEGHVGYIYADFVFYNILFDEKDWKCTIKFVCTKTCKRKEICSVVKEVVVSKNDNTFSHLGSWGNEDKGFWKKGGYTWKVYLDEKLVGEVDFVVNNRGLVSANSNPYFDVNSLKFFSSDTSTVPSIDKRKYFSQLVPSETGYLCAELTIYNFNNTEEELELVCNYKDKAGRVVGRSVRHISISKKSKFTEVFKWGNSSKSIWALGAYSVDIIFQDHVVASASIIMSETKAIEGIPQLHSKSINVSSTVNDSTSGKSLTELLADLDKMIGLKSIKKQIKEHIDFVKFEQMRHDKGIAKKSYIKLHTVLTGNPGTGKTTVAKKLGAIYKAMGLLTSGHVHEVDRADLVGEYIGKTAPKTKKEIEKARGGILFIDEAYSLFRKETDNDYGQEVIEILLKEMSDGVGDIMIVGAGYPDEMNDFLMSNPGLKSRFSQFFKFPDYTPDELLEISELVLKKHQLDIANNAKDFLLKKLTHAFRDRDKSFGNARYVNSLISSAKMNMASRLIKLPNASELSDIELSTITLLDVKEIFFKESGRKLNLTVDENILNEAMSELNELVGLESVKSEIKDLTKLVRYYKEIGKDVMNQFVLHTVFTGNPGTGKTTVARIFAKLFKGLGLLEKGHLVECDRSDLVASYIGQTASKTAAIIERSIGGVLFIDEAYSLANKGEKDFGQEAISTILKQMEDRNTDFIVIAAGYPDNMHEFLNSNPGLRSRFEKTMKFDDYNAEDLFTIINLMLSKEDLEFTEDASIKVKAIIVDMVTNKGENFGNAREVRKIAQQIIRDHNLRLADVSSDLRTIEMISQITLDDINEGKLKSSRENNSRGSIGFKF